MLRSRPRHVVIATTIITIIAVTVIELSVSKVPCVSSSSKSTILPSVLSVASRFLSTVFSGLPLLFRSVTVIVVGLLTRDFGRRDRGNFERSRLRIEVSRDQASRDYHRASFVVQFRLSLDTRIYQRGYIVVQCASSHVRLDVLRTRNVRLTYSSASTFTDTYTHANYT